MMTKRQMSSKKVLATCAGTLCAVMLMLLCVTSVSAFGQNEIHVVDGAVSVSFRTESTELNQILDEAAQHGISPLEASDYAEYNSETGEVMISRRIFVSITDGSNTLYTETYSSNTVGEILDENNITLEDGCVSYPAQTDYVREGSVITVGHLNLDPSAYQNRTAAYLSDASPLRSRLVSVSGGVCNVLLKVNDKVINLELNRGMTVGQILKDHDITITASDFINVSESDMIYDDMCIVVKKALNVTVQADGQTAHITLFGGNVSDALRVAGVELNEEDLVSPSAKTAVKDGTAIKVSRVTYAERTVTEEIAYGRDEIEDDSMYVGQEVVETEGVKGSQKVVYRDKLVDGVRKSSEVVSKKVTKKPVNEVVRVGTQVQAAVGSSGGAGTAVDHNGNTFSYSSVLVGSGTAYYGGGITATGMPAQVGVVAVDPDIIPYGTRLYIVSCDGQIVYGYCIAGDTGGFADDGSAIADLYYDTYDECVQFGRRDICVYILS